MSQYWIDKIIWFVGTGLVIVLMTVVRDLFNNWLESRNADKIKVEEKDGKQSRTDHRQEISITRLDGTLKRFMDKQDEYNKKLSDAMADIAQLLIHRASQDEKNDAFKRDIYRVEENIKDIYQKINNTNIEVAKIKGNAK